MRVRLNTKRGLLIAGAAGLVVVVGALAAAYFLLFPTSSEKRFTLKTPAEPSATATATAAAGSTSAGGNWVIASGSKAGYRVREKLAFLPAKSDAVGRTSAITGSATLKTSGKRVTVRAAAFKIDLSQLKSDKDMRDQRIHQIGLESDRYPTATFKLSQPLKLSGGATAGKVVKVPATGVFTIHGTSKTETVPLQLRLTDTTLQAVGSLTFPWSEFGMTAPSVAGFVNVTDKATMEFDLRLKSR
jgi:polyisoprenoid-binding protein YceI